MNARTRAAYARRTALVATLTKPAGVAELAITGARIWCFFEHGRCCSTADIEHWTRTEVQAAIDRLFVHEYWPAGLSVVNGTEENRVVRLRCERCGTKIRRRVWSPDRKTLVIEGTTALAEIDPDLCVVCELDVIEACEASRGGE